MNRQQLMELATGLRAQATDLSRRYLGPSQAVGLDVGADSAKAVQVVDLGERLEVRLFGWTPLREVFGPQEPTPLSGEEVSARLRGLIEGWGFPGGRLVANLSGQDCLVRRVKLPFADLKKSAKVIPFELESDLPVPFEDLVLELFPFAAAEGAPEGAGPPALALVTTRERVTERLALLAGARLSPRALEADPLALYQTFCALHPEQTEAAVLDLGARKSTLLVVREGQLKAVRSIPFGGDALTLALVGQWNVTFEVAERLKRERCAVVSPQRVAQATPKQLEASGIICAGLVPLLLEIRRTLLASAPDPGAADTEEQARCPRLYLCGGGCLLPGLAGHLARELECEVWPLARSERLSLAGDVPPGAEALLPGALGLALRRLRRLSPVDFRRSELASGEETAGRRSQLTYLGAALGVAALMGLVGLSVRASALETRLEAVKVRTEEVYRQAFPGKGALPDPVRQMEKNVKDMESMPLPSLGGGQPVLEVMRGVSGASTGGLKVKVTLLTVEPQTVRIEGEADTKETLTRFRMSLLKTKLFKDCLVKPAATQPKVGRVGFSLELKRVPNAA